MDPVVEPCLRKTARFFVKHEVPRVSAESSTVGGRAVERMAGQDNTILTEITKCCFCVVSR